jgi:hypothetical protein
VQSEEWQWKSIRQAQQLNQMNKPRTRKIALLVVIFLLIILVVAFCVYIFASSDTKFGLADGSEITRFRIVAATSKVILEKKNDSWYLINGSPAHSSLVDDAVYALSLLQVKGVLPQSAENEYKTTLKGALKISLGSGFISKRTYQLCKVKDLGLVGVLRGKKTPYLLEVRGNSELDVLDMLNANPLYWKQNVVFAFTPSEIRSVTVENIIEPQQSYVVQVDTLGQVKIMDAYSGKKLTPIAAEKVKKYLSYFTHVGFERYVTNLNSSEVENILLADFAYMVTVEDIYGSKQSAKLFFVPKDDTLDAFGRPTKVDLNRCYVQINDEPQLALALWVDMDILLPGFEYFMNN